MAAMFLRFWKAKVKDLLLRKGFVSRLRAAALFWNRLLTLPNQTQKLYCPQD